MRWYCPDCGVQVTRFDYVDAAADRWSHCLGCREYKFFKPVPSELEWKRAEDLRMERMAQSAEGRGQGADSGAARSDFDSGALLSAPCAMPAGLPEWVAGLGESLKDAKDKRAL